jgi:hypothetical protein
MKKRKKASKYKAVAVSQWRKFEEKHFDPGVCDEEQSTR